MTRAALAAIDPTWADHPPAWVRAAPAWASPVPVPAGEVKVQVQPVPAGDDGRVLDITNMPWPLRVTLIDRAQNRPFAHWFANPDSGLIERHLGVWIPKLDIPAVTIVVDHDSQPTGGRFERRRTLTLHRVDEHPEVAVTLRVWGESGWREVALTGGRPRQLQILARVPTEHLTLRVCEYREGRHSPHGLVRKLDGSGQIRPSDLSG